MNLTQSWVGYLTRSYEQIKQSLINRLTVIAPEITDHTETNLLIIIASMFSGIGEMLNLYIDRAAEESFLATARKYSSVVRLSKLIDYQIKAKNPASADLLLTLTDTSGVETAYEHPITIPAGTAFTNYNNIVYYLLADALFAVGKTQVYASAVNKVKTLNEVIGSTTGVAGQRILLPKNYVHKSLQITIATLGTFTEFSSFGLMLSTTKGFVVSIEEDGNAYVNFGDGVNGILPSASHNITATYYTTDGSLGNSAPNTITQLASVLSMPSGYTIKATNPNYAVGGEDFESIDQIKNRAPRDLRLQNRIVTEQDYLDAPLQVPGIGDAAVSYDCGKFVNIYVSPSETGIATTQQLADVLNYMNTKKTIGKFLSVQPAGISKIWIEGTIYAKPLLPEIDVQLQVAEALDLAYGYSGSKINNKVVASEIIALIENLDKVDRFDLAKVRILPYARPLDSTSHILNITYNALPKSTAKHVYKILYNGTDFEVYKDNTLSATVASGGTYSDGDLLNFTLNASTYTTNDSWQLTVYPSYPEIFPSTLIQIDDYTKPIVEVADYVDENTQRTIYGNLTIV